MNDRLRGRFAVAARSSGSAEPRPAGSNVRNEALAALHDLQNRLASMEAMVNGANLIDQVLSIVTPALDQPEPLHSLSEAARITGYSADHLGRLLRDGVIPNHGQKGRPRVRVSEIPVRQRSRRGKAVHGGGK